jgi:nucleoside 2-deoxyribosyltransferase
LKLTAEVVTNDESIAWLIPGESTWTIDLDKLSEFVPGGKSRFGFFSGQIQLEPDVEVSPQIERDSGVHYVAGVIFFLIPDSTKHTSQIYMTPNVIKDSLADFQADHPHPNKAAFIMMGFGETTAHANIVKAVRKSLSKHGISGLRADDKEYHEDLLPNVRTYMHGCNFGIAIFERIESEEFNPNVGLEVGYMMAMGKPVCLLKDQTLKDLHTDLIGKLYRRFDVLNPAGSIPDQVDSWLNDKRLIGPQRTLVSSDERPDDRSLPTTREYTPSQLDEKILLVYRYYDRSEIGEKEIYKHFPGERIEVEHALEELRANDYLEVGRIGEVGRYYELTARGREFVITLPKPPAA